MSIVPSAINVKQQKFNEFYRNLTQELKSKIQERSDGDRCKCLVKFHNCTPYRVTPFWLDFQGLPIKYPDLPRGAFINIDTYKSHLWFFKAHAPNSLTNYDPIRILALPEENLSRALPFLKSELTDNRAATGESLFQVVRESILGLNNSLICSLCRHILTNHSIGPSKVPCPHFTGETKYAISDLDIRSWLNFGSSYIYHCAENNHREAHSMKRRNIYLVEPFINLRERCFLAIKKQIKQSEIVDLDLPISLQYDYLEYITTLKKISGKDNDDA